MVRSGRALAQNHEASVQKHRVNKVKNDTPLQRRLLMTRNLCWLKIEVSFKRVSQVRRRGLPGLDAGSVRFQTPIYN